MVVMAQGKQGNQGIWMFIFPDREKQREFAKNIKKMISHREFNSQHRENFEVLKIKRHFRVAVDVATIFWLFEVNIELEGQPKNDIFCNRLHYICDCCLV